MRWLHHHCWTKMTMQAVMTPTLMRTVDLSQRRSTWTKDARIMMWRYYDRVSDTVCRYHEVVGHVMIDKKCRSVTVRSGQPFERVCIQPHVDVSVQMLNSMLPKRRFWKEEQEMKCGWSMHFSMVSGPNRVLTTLKSASIIRISSLVPPSKIFVWEG